MQFLPPFRRRLALTLALVWALLWAPVWGQWHGIAHQVHQAVTVSATASAQAESVVQIAMDEGHEVGSALCQVLDHLGHASALTAWPLWAGWAALPMATPSGHWLSSHGQQPWWPAQARAPPHRI